MGSFGCPHDVNGICQKVRGAICQPGMRGCVLAGKVELPGGVLPAPRWPAPADEAATPETAPPRTSRRRRRF